MPVNDEELEEAGTLVEITVVVVDVEDVRPEPELELGVSTVL